jgi:hypothetical protein
MNPFTLIGGNNFLFYMGAAIIYPALTQDLAIVVLLAKVPS